MGDNLRVFNEENLYQKHKLDYYQWLSYIQQISTPQELEQLADALLHLGRYHWTDIRKCK